MVHHKAVLARLKTKLDEKTGALSDAHFNPGDPEDRVLLVRMRQRVPQRACLLSLSAFRTTNDPLMCFR